MRNLSITQEYLLCAFNENGKLYVGTQSKAICFIAGALLELNSDCYVKIQDKKIVVEAELEKDHYLYPMYNFIKNSKAKTVKNIASSYIFSLTSKNFYELIDSVGQSLVAENCVKELCKTSIFGKEKHYYIPNKETIDYIVQKIRAELLENGNLDDEVIALTCLLNKSGLLKQYFSKYESQQLQDRLKEMKNSAPNMVIKDMLDYIEAITVAIVISSTAGR